MIAGSDAEVMILGPRRHPCSCSVPASGPWSCPPRLSKELGDQIQITLIDRADTFVFGFSKLDVMFGKRPLDAVRMFYADITTPRVRFRQESIVSIDPASCAG